MSLLPVSEISRKKEREKNKRKEKEIGEGGWGRREKKYQSNDP
jgi:hypothetical protein